MNKKRINNVLMVLLIICVFVNSTCLIALADEEEDVTKPRVLSVSVSGNDFVNGYARMVHYHIDAYDETKLDLYPFSFDGGKNWEKEGDFIISENGLHHILIKDAANNIFDYELRENRIDKKGPEVTDIGFVFEKSCNHFGRSVNVIIGAKDNQSGLNKAAFCFDGLNYTKLNSHMYYENGEYKALIKDGLGNVTEFIIPVDCVDSKAPVIRKINVEGSVSANGFCKSKRISIDAYDEGAGLVNECYSFDGGQSFEKSNVTEINENTTLRIVVRDGLGHCSYEKIVVDDIDNIAPVINEAKLNLYNESNGYGDKGLLIVDALDEESGLAKDAFSFDGGKSYIEDNKIEVIKNGQIDVCIKDAVGNIYGCTYFVNNIDDILPSIKVSNKESVYNFSEASLKISAKDTQSGIEGIYYENANTKKLKKIVDGKGANEIEDSLVVTKNGIYTFVVKDMAGNESTTNIKVTKIGTTPPKSNSSSSIIIKGDSKITNSESSLTSLIFGDGDEEGSISTSVYSKEIVLDEEEDFEFEDDDIEEIIDFDDGELLIADAEGDVYEPIKSDTYEGELEEALAKKTPQDIKIEYPDEENDDKGKIIAIAVGITLFLLGVLVIALYKMNLLSPNKIKEKIINKK